MNIQPDKLLHAVAGSIAAAAGVAIGDASAWLGYAAGHVWPGIAACAVAALLREAWNWWKGGKFDLRDIAATMLGGVPVMASVLAATT